MTISIRTEEGEMILVPWVAAFLFQYWQRTMRVENPKRSAR